MPRPDSHLRRRGPVLAAIMAVSGGVLPASGAAMGPPPSEFGVDAPELARLGTASVGIRTLSVIQRNQVDLLAPEASGAFPKRDRSLTVDIWYPAVPAPGAARETYSASLPSEPPAAPARFTVPGIAVRDARAAGTGYPLVVVSHGYSNATVAMTWLTENLASKGYVVAAIRHEDPPITDRSKFPQPALRRPLDIAYVSRSLQTVLAKEHLIDPAKTALIGYSMGGYGVLTAAGATLDPAGSLAKIVPNGLLLPYARGGGQRDAVLVKGLRAVVAMSPVGGGSLGAWGAGIRDVSTPLLLISGDSDRTVDYATGARAMFEGATGAQRYLLTFKGCGHAIGLNPVPEQMRGRLWDQDWFEDPVWRKERINAISAHFITAFLDLYLRGDASRAAYLNVATSDSSAGVWPNSGNFPYNAYSPGSDGITVWKGFQLNHAAGLELLQAGPAAR